jgi:hypothetical protein
VDFSPKPNLIDLEVASIQLGIVLTLESSQTKKSITLKSSKLNDKNLTPGLMREEGDASSVLAFLLAERD